MNPTSPFSIPNIRLFIAFRIFFNSRFYYPVFTILFLDYGLTLDQFALLNTIWAITIVCTEVPSGALADLLGRKQLLVLTSILMITELSVIAFVPTSNISLIFWAFLFNRILSGLAEAMASGADEAIAYDSLIKHKMQEHWPRVLSVQMRLSALAGVISMTTGAFLYDFDIVNRLIAFFGSEVTVNQEMSMRYPIYLTLILAVLAFWSSLKMQEVDYSDGKKKKHISLLIVWQTASVTWQAGLWIMRTPFALAVILFGMTYDHVLRMVITLASQYFREIQLPEASFGLIMAGISLLGLLIPKIAEHMVAKFTPVWNCLWLALITLTALWGLSSFTQYIGILPMALVMIGLMLTSFFTSYYLNNVTSSEQRATVLSFKGLAFNLAYGIIGVLFALLMQYQRNAIQSVNPVWEEKLVESTAFQATIGWFPEYGLILIAAIALFSFFLLKQTDTHKMIPETTAINDQDSNRKNSKT